MFVMQVHNTYQNQNDIFPFQHIKRVHAVKDPKMSKEYPWQLHVQVVDEEQPYIYNLKKATQANFLMHFITDKFNTMNINVNIIDAENKE